MNDEKLIFQRPDDEISALIKTLHQTERRLEELTAGEVDSVTDREGRTFLLRRAQEQLRAGVLATQAGILNALPAHIAMIDADGIIISVNEAWERVAAENFLLGPGSAIGVNYLDICDRAQGEACDEARPVAEGIRKVLRGEIKSFSIEYPSHLPSEERWFLMTVTPLAADASNGAIVMHINSSERKHAESALLRLAGAMDATVDAIFLVDRTNMRFVYVNDAACRMLEQTREALLALRPADVFAVPVAELERSYDRIIDSHETDAPIEIRHLRADGSELWMELRRQAQRKGNGWLMVTMVRDVTQQKQVAVALLETESLKRAILVSSPDCIVTIDHEGNIVEFNVAAEAAFGVPRKVAFGKNMVELIIAPRMREALNRKLTHYLATGHGPVPGKRVELAAIRADGSEFPIELTVASISGTSTPMYTGFIRDVTVQHADQQRLRESESRFRSLSSLSSDWFWEQDDQFRFVAFAGGEGEARWSGHQFISMGLRRWELAGVSAPGQGWQKHKLILDAHKPFRNFEYQRTFEDGSIKHISVSGEPLFDANNHFTGYRGVAADITARKRAALDLFERERRFSDMLDNVRLVSLMVDHEARITYCNDYMLTLTGWRLDEVIGRNAFEVFVPHEVNAMQDFFTALLAGKPEARHRVNEISTRSGERRLISWNNSPLRSGADDVTGMASIGEDITERVRAEESLRVSEMQQRKIAEQLEVERSRLVAAQQVAKIGGWETDLLNMSVIWSAETHRIFETDATNFPPTHQAFLEMVHPEDRVRVDNEFQRSLAERSALPVTEHRLLMPDGRIKFVEERWQVNFDALDKPTDVVGTCQDITERKLREIALHESEEKFHQLADNISDVFWIRSPDLEEVHYVSPAFEKIWGRTVESLRLNPQRWHHFVHPEDRERVMAAFASLRNEAQSLDFEYRIVRPDGDIRWVHARAFPVRDDAGTVIRLAGIVSDITVRREIDQAFRRQHTELRLLFDLMPAMIWFKDTKNRILRVNQRAADAAGKSIAEIEGKPSLEIYPNDAARFYVDDLEVINSGMPKLGIVEALPDTDGKQFWLQTDKVPYFDEHQEVAGIVVMAQDITARVESAAALQASLAEFRSLAESMPQIVWIARADGRHIYFNQQWIDYTGLTLAESLDDAWTKPFHPNDRGRAATAWQLATTKTGIYAIECRLRRTDGVYRWWLMRAEPLRDDVGKILKWFGTCTDIHEMKVAEEEIAQTSLALRESERRFSDLLRNVELASVMLDREARITFCNDYLLRLTDWKYDEVIGRNWFELFIPAQSSVNIESFTKLLQNQSDQLNRENWILTRSGEQRLMRWSNSVLRSGTGDVIGSASIGEDITDRKRAEDEILRLNADLETRVEARTAELQAVNQELEAFDYSISHDLKAPIRHVDGFSTMLLEDYGDKLDAHGRSCVMRIQGAAKRMDQLVGDLLALSLISRGELHRIDVDLSVLARQIFAVLRQSEPDREIDFVVAPDIKVKADAGLVRIVLDNLFGNARKFTAKRVDAKIEFGCMLIDGMPAFFVRDNGAGFDAAYADKLFAPFQRLHAQSEFKGTGIGLATVRRIITRHGGKVWAEGAVDLGATVYFTLPS